MSDREGDFEPIGLPDFLRDLPGIPKRYGRWMLAIALVGLVLTTIAVVMWEPLYSARASILVTRQQIPDDFIRSTVREGPFSRFNATVSQVLSRPKLMALIDEFELYSDLRADSLMAEIVGQMRSHIEIEPQQQGRRGRSQSSRIYTVAFDGENPEVAAAVANRLAILFVEAGIQVRMEQAESISSFLRAELIRTEEELRQQNRLIAEFNERYRGELPSELQANLGKLDRLQLRRQSLENQVIDAESRSSLTPAGPMEPGSPLARLAELRRRWDAEMSVHTEEHPTVIALSRQIARLEDDITGGRASSGPDRVREAALAQARATLANLRRQLSAVDAEITDLDGRVSRTPSRQEALSALTEKTSVLRSKYLEFLRKVDAAELAQTMETAQQSDQISIMDRAHPPAKPKDSWLSRLGLGVAASLFAALGVGLLLEFLDPVIVSEDQVERLTGVPVLGAISRIA